MTRTAAATRAAAELATRSKVSGGVPNGELPWVEGDLFGSMRFFCNQRVCCLLVSGFKREVGLTPGTAGEGTATCDDEAGTVAGGGQAVGGFERGTDTETKAGTEAAAEAAGATAVDRAAAEATGTAGAGCLVPSPPRCTVVFGDLD